MERRLDQVLRNFENSLRSLPALAAEQRDVLRNIMDHLAESVDKSVLAGLSDDNTAAAGAATTESDMKRKIQTATAELCAAYGAIDDCVSRFHTPNNTGDSDRIRAHLNQLCNCKVVLLSWITRCCLDLIADLHQLYDRLAAHIAYMVSDDGTPPKFLIDAICASRDESQESLTRRFDIMAGSLVEKPCRAVLTMLNAEVEHTKSFKQVLDDLMSETTASH